MANLTASDVAKYILSLISEESGDTISNLKLQKLVYYSQGYHLAIYDKPLFGDTIEKWQHGPVVESLYHEYKNNGFRSIKKPELNDVFFAKFSDETKNFLNMVYNALGRFSAWVLRDMTHKEPPWKNAVTNNVITEMSMKTYFKTQIK